MSAADLIVRFLVGQVVQAFQRELEKPDGWEADPKTRTIRRRGARKPRERVEVKTETSTRGGSEDVIDVCPWCGYIMPLHTKAGQCPKE